MKRFPLLSVDFEPNPHFPGIESRRWKTPWPQLLLGIVTIWSLELDLLSAWGSETQVDCRGLVAGELSRKYCEKAVCCDFNRGEVRPSSHWKVWNGRRFLYTVFQWPLNLLPLPIFKDHKESVLLCLFLPEEAGETLRRDCSASWQLLTSHECFEVQIMCLYSRAVLFFPCLLRLPYLFSEGFPLNLSHYQSQKH